MPGIKSVYVSCDLCCLGNNLLFLLYKIFFPNFPVKSFALANKVVD